MWCPYDSVKCNHRFNALGSFGSSYFLSWGGIINTFSKGKKFVIILAKNVFLAFEELNKHEILSNNETKFRSFGYPQSEETLLMKSGASKVDTIVVMLWDISSQIHWVSVLSFTIFLKSSHHLVLFAFVSTFKKLIFLRLWEPRLYSARLPLTLTRNTF